MADTLSRRKLLGSALAAAPTLLAARPDGTLIDSHVHLFAGDETRFPYHPNATYKPQPAPLEEYLKFATSYRLDHAVIVHPEPYQDDHRYLEYCFAHEPSPRFFKGTCLFDPIAAGTPSRIDALMKRNPGRIVALRIHEVRKAGDPPLTSGAIHDRDMHSPAMKSTWRAVHDMGLAIQMHFHPYYAPQIGELASQFPDLPVILDHLGRGGQGTPEQFDGVLALAKLPKVYMKYSGLDYSSKQQYPYADVKPMVRRAFDAFGPDRLIWGYFGMNAADFEKQAALLNMMFDFTSEANRAKIRGGNALKFYRF